MPEVRRRVRAEGSRTRVDRSVFGLSIRTSLDIPCPRVPRARTPDVSIDAASATQLAGGLGAVPPNRRRQWFCSARLQDGSRYLRWKGLFEFLISPDGRKILYRRLSSASEESLAVYLLGQVLSFSLVARGDEPLHGTVVVIDGDAVALVGDCGRGKSTLGAALLARGFPILTDDLVVIPRRGRSLRVVPGLPRIKLFPRVARYLLGGELRGTPMNRATRKLVLPLSGEQVVRRAVRLKALYVLSDPAIYRSTRSGMPAIQRLRGQEAFLEVIRSAFNLLVIERKRLTTQFSFARRLAARVSIRRLSYPRKLSALPEVCDAILADLRR